MALQRFLADKQARVAAISPASVELVAAIADLTLRGGKRLRPAVMEAGFASVCDRPVAEVEDAGDALELLQTYLLIHDDWMDGDDTRRGGPTVHRMLGDQHGDPHLGASLAILAGDLACTYAWTLINRQSFPHGRKQQGLELFARMHEEVILGQHLDLVHSHDVERMHDLKTASYTVRGPLLLGAVLGGGDDGALAALEAIGTSLGIAFQLRDDLLGTFGDAAATGKPVGADLRAGKETALIHEARRSLSVVALTVVEAVLGQRDATDAAIDHVTALLESEGIRARIETRLEALVSQARAHLEAAALRPAGVERLATLIAKLTRRDK